MPTDCQPYRVLYIAPEAPGLPALAWWEEASKIAAISGVDLTIISRGQATTEHVAQALRRGADLIIIAAHGAPNEIILADGCSVDGAWLATQARPGKPECVVIGACLSGVQDYALRDFGRELSRIGIHAVVFGVAVEDRAAGVYSVEFVRAMCAGSDVAQADLVAGLAAKRAYPKTSLGAQLVPALMNGYREVLERIECLGSDLAATKQETRTQLEEVLRRLTLIEDKIGPATRRRSS